MYRWELTVVDEDDTSGAHEPTEEDEVDEHAVEPMISVYESQIEAATFAQEAWKCGFGSLWVVLHQVRDPGLIKKLQSAIAEPGCLVRIDDHMPCGA